MRWAYEDRTKGCTPRAMDWAAQNGHLHVLQWLHVNRTEGCTSRSIDLAASNGHLHIVDWLESNYLFKSEP